MININNIYKSFGDKQILSDFSLNISKGEYVCIVGPSGAGKTTLLNIIGFLDKPDSGIVKIADYQNPTSQEIQALRRNVFGYIFQNYLLMDNETVLKNLLISKKYNRDFDENLLTEVLEEVGIDSSLLNKKVYELSGGEQQKVAILRVMLKPCEIILADEPTGNLDSNNKDNIISMFSRLKNLGKTIVCVTHDNDFAEKADRIIRLV